MTDFLVLIGIPMIGAFVWKSFDIMFERLDQLEDRLTKKIKENKNE